MSISSCRASLLILGALAGCHALRTPPAGPFTSESPPIADPLAPAIVLGPIAAPAARFSAPVEPAGDSAIFDGLAARAPERDRVLHDPRIDAAAADLAAVAAAGALPDADEIELALRAHGVIDSARQTIASWAADDAGVLAGLGDRLDASLAAGDVSVGVGRDHGVTIVIVTRAKLVRFLPIPRALPEGGEVDIDGVLDRKLVDPRVTLTREDFRAEHPIVAIGDDGAFRVHVTCGAHFGVQYVLVEGRDASDPSATPVAAALFPISCGEQPAAKFVAEPDANDHHGDVERALSSIINRERAKAHLAPLWIDVRAADVARAYAATMLHANRVDHDLGGRDPIQRLRAARLIAPVVFEATLHAPDLRRASEILLDHPEYRWLIIDPQLTHVGIGVARDPHGELYVAIELVRITPHHDPDAIRAGALARIRAAIPRKLEVDGALERVAQRHAEQLALGWGADDLATGLGDELRWAPFESLERAIANGAEPGELDLGQLIEGADTADHLGIGVAQSIRNGSLAGRVWVVVVYGNEIKKH